MKMLSKPNYISGWFKEKYNFLYVLSKGGNTVTANINVTFALATISFFAFILESVWQTRFGLWKNDTCLWMGAVEWSKWGYTQADDIVNVDFLSPLAHSEAAVILSWLTKQALDWISASRLKRGFVLSRINKKGFLNWIYWICV